MDNMIFATITNEKKHGTNCPNCGAIIEKSICPYCGTMFYDFSVIDPDKPFWLKIKKDGKIYTTKVFMSSLSIEMNYCDQNINMTLSCVPYSKDEIFKERI